MVIFEKIEFKNFLSYGNKKTTWDFKPGSVTRITGKNGIGKSACVVDPLYFALFGKTYRKQTKEQLVNWINKKELEVKIWFSVSSVKYYIERGLKPAYLYVYKFDEQSSEYELVPVSSTSRNYQKIIEEEILSMNESIFNQTIIKSMTKNISFMTLSKGEKRHVVESILGIEVFSHMNDLSRTKLQENKFDTELLLGEIAGNNNLIDAEMNNLQSLKQIKETMEKESKNKIVDLERDLKIEIAEKEKFEIGLEKLDKYIKQESIIEAQLEAVQQENKIKKQSKKEIEAEILIQSKKIEMFEKTCPECPKVKEMKADESESEKHDYLEKLTVSIEKNNLEIKEFKKDLAKVQKILTNETFIKNTITSCNREIKKLKREILKTQEQKEVVVIDESNLKKFSVNRDKLEIKYAALTKAKRHLQVLKTLLADEGIKSFIIKRYLPHINKILNTYLQKFNTEILFYFDTEFNDIIGSRYKEGSNYGCFSEGQKRRIDLAILFTFIDFSQIKNRKSNCNVLVLDEITAG